MCSFGPRDLPTFVSECVLCTHRDTPRTYKSIINKLAAPRGIAASLHLTHSTHITNRLSGVRSGSPAANLCTCRRRAALLLRWPHQTLLNWSCALLSHSRAPPTKTARAVVIFLDADYSIRSFLLPLAKGTGAFLRQGKYGRHSI